MVKLNLLVFAFVFSAALSINAEAKLYKWVDDSGTTHYGEVIPPEYANKNKDVIDKAGLIEKRPPKVTPEELRAKEEAEQKRKVENQAAMEQQRRDSALLNTYTNENEIDLARDRSLVLINARIESNKMLLKSSETTLDGLKKESASRTKEGKKIPQSLANDIATMETRINRYQTELSKSEEDLVAVKSRFDKEKELYRKIKGGASSK